MKRSSSFSSPARHSPPGLSRTVTTLVRSQGAGSAGGGRIRLAAESRTRHVNLRRVAPASGRTARRRCARSESNRATPLRRRQPGSPRSGAKDGELARSRTAPRRVAISADHSITSSREERPPGLEPGSAGWEPVTLPLRYGRDEEGVDCSRHPPVSPSPARVSPVPRVSNPSTGQGAATENRTRVVGMANRHSTAELWPQ